MLRVLHIISDTNIGGAGRHLLTFLEHFDRTKLAVYVLCPPASLLLEQCVAMGIKTYTSPYLAGDRSFGWRGLSGLIRELGVIARDCRIDIVHTHASFSGRLAAKAVRVPRIVYTKHRMDWGVSRGWFKKKVIAYLNRLTSHRVIAVSLAVKEDLLSDGVPEKKIALIYNGVDIEKLREQARPEKLKSIPCLGNSRVVGMVARLEPEKGHRYFLEASSMVLAKLENVFFIVVGTGSLADDLRETAKNLGISERVLFTGYQDDIAKFIAMMDVMVIPSLTEAFGISMIEGMCLGKPCVASAVGGLVEIAGQDGRVAFLVPPGNAEAIAEKVIFLLENPGFAGSMGSHAAEEVEIRFSAEKMAGEIASLYYEMMKCN
ncbi:glycosyltransferase family 4 protein [Pelotomaculum isophthalicicum JI]|uniref:Glycosyltransferase family 4 protein n=1 Tax=Pelotomaculum isophthalicicum JI TaxID=947010 RepID=A0A9X4H3I4_9FIRM|nr:glycosyltransferase family 4 protein [Pelotomaculum isophthalicicum]MDF9406962.1 glycosyltransferase family 4 protein [Pelotomaculum isophthalicicum JI]